MITVEQFKDLCRTKSAEDVVDEVLLIEDAVHVPEENRAYLLSRLASTYGVKETDLRLWIVGSAKLGFSMVEKRKNGLVLPRYRPFTGISDIDTAIVSPEIFRLIWDELSIYAHGQPWMPWDSGRLGDYMVYGWLRPDHFPGGQRVRRCNDWWDLFRRFSADDRFGKHSVRGGLFYSVSDLRRYLRRSVLVCIQNEREQI